MKSGRNPRVIFSTILCLMIFSGIATAQTYHFLNYGTRSNIPDGFVYTLNQDSTRYIWVGTGKGISRFDGFSFYNVPFPDSSVSRYPSASLLDNKGRLWFGCSDGSVYYSNQGNLVKVAINNQRSVISLIESPDGLIYVIPQGKSLYRIDPEEPDKVINLGLSQDIVLFSAGFTGSGKLLAGTQENITVFDVSGDSLKSEGTIEGFDYSSVTAIFRLKGENSFIIGTEGNGLYLLDYVNERGYLSKLKYNDDVEYASVHSIIRDSHSDLWVSTNESGILQLTLTPDEKSVSTVKRIDSGSGLPGNNVKLVFQDVERNYWIGLIGNGLSMLNSYAFSFYYPGGTTGQNNVIYTGKLLDEYFLGTPDGYYLYDLDFARPPKFIDVRRRTGNREVVSYCIDKQMNLWIGTKGSGLFVKMKNGDIRQFRLSGDSGEDNITDIEVTDNQIILGTLNGVVSLDSRSGTVKNRYNINNGLPHNMINTLYVASNGKIALGMKSEQLYLIDPVNGIEMGDFAMIGTTLNEISSVAQDRYGNFWVATMGNGVFEITRDSIRSITRSNLLMSDYAYGILADSLNRIWIGHENGFSRYNSTTSVMRTFGTEFTHGGLCNPGAMYESAGGKILIGTTEGLVVYDNRRDLRIKEAPVSNINSVIINDQEYPLQESYILPYRKKYDIRVNYTGIYFSDPEKVYYQTYLEDWDDDWSKLKSDRYEEYSLTDGHYKFILVSYSEDGLSQEKPVSFEITIKKPVWRTWWAILLYIAATSGIVVLIIREREKAQKKIRLYLEQELEARTSVVMKQKVELELQNIEITDSINYAKRIQSSILPDFHKLKETFHDAFIFFRPRDIVSGDFYWFDKLDEERFILVCADSTGHGVPGAFMSMIGSTLLQDIVNRQRISKPSQILGLLDRQIFSTLNQNIELGVSNDGMDMVVCEINARTRHVRFASAMRPVIIVLSGEPFYIKGNRSSVGGESVVEKFFDDQEYFLSPGDTIYVFSDGLPDQFGGSDGKKMKIARLKKIIEDVTSLPMPDQLETIQKFYDEWKGDYEQVDDILLIGLRL